MENLANLTVYVGTSLNHKGKVCGSFNGPVVGRGRVYIKCDKPVVGKAVTIVKHANDSLVLCEVMSVGTNGKKNTDLFRSLFMPKSHCINLSKHNCKYCLLNTKLKQMLAPKTSS